MPSVISGPFEAQEISQFLDTHYYTQDAFFLDEVVRLDRDQNESESVVATDTRRWPIAELQRIGPHHPLHLSAGELLMITGCVASLHAWFFHGCRWEEGWAGFGSRIHRADFKSIAKIGPPLTVVGRETQTRVGPKRVMMRAAFNYYQEDRLVYRSDQSAFFFADRELG